MSKKSRFRGCFDRIYGKRAQALSKSALQHLDHIHWSQARILCSKKYPLLVSEYPFHKQHGKRPQALSKPALHHLYQIHWSLPSQLTRKKSAFITSKILGLLVNTLAVDEKYPVLNRDNFTIPIKMQLSQEQKTFAQFFAAFLKCRINFEYF